MTERWLSLDEISAHLGVSKKTIYSWLSKGTIPAVKMGRLWKFKASLVDKWMIEKDTAKRSSNKLRNRKL